MSRQLQAEARLSRWMNRTDLLACIAHHSLGWSWRRRGCGLRDEPAERPGHAGGACVGINRCAIGVCAGLSNDAHLPGERAARIVRLGEQINRDVPAGGARAEGGRRRAAVQLFQSDEIVFVLAQDADRGPLQQDRLVVALEGCAIKRRKQQRRGVLGRAGRRGQRPGGERWRWGRWGSQAAALP